MSVEILRNCPYVARAQVESPVGLVVVRADGRTNAITVSFFSEVAHHPTAMWISIARSSYTHELLTGAGAFSFITLHKGQAEIAVACGTASGREKNKCEKLALYDNGHGGLFLKDAMASVACQVTRTVPLGDHTLFLANILAGDMRIGRVTLPNLLISDLKAL